MADSVLHAICRESDSENSERGTPPGEAGNTTQATEVHINTQIPFGLRSKELFVFRWTLRLFSLWSPRSACFAERVFYLAMVNILLLLQIAMGLYKMFANGGGRDIFDYLNWAMFAEIYLSHFFAVRYFKSRDLEDNMLNVNLNVRCFSKFRKKLTRLTLGIILSYLFLVVAIFVIFFSDEDMWSNGRFQCNLQVKFLKGFAKDFICLLTPLTAIYWIGISWALSWTMCLFQQTCSARLQQLSQNYLSWTRSTEEAVYDHLTNYSRKVKTSCEHLKIWFIVQNITFIIVTPFFFVALTQTGFPKIDSNNAMNICFEVFYLVIWLAPLYFAEQLQIHDEDLCTRVNEFCPGTIEELEGELRAQSSNSINPNQESYTFHSRTEVNKFLSYLKNRKSGFVIGSYSFQLKMSVFSVFLAIITFASRKHF